VSTAIVARAARRRLRHQDEPRLSHLVDLRPIVAIVTRHEEVFTSCNTQEAKIPTGERQ
jgi:hypothetical protein